MAINAEQVVEALGSHLQGSVSYIGTVWLVEDESQHNPKFSRTESGYGVQMMNPVVTPEARIGRLRRQLFTVDLRLLRRRGGPQKSRLRGTGGSDKGIYEFAADVETVLLHNTLGTILDPYPGVSIDTFNFEPSEAQLVAARTTFRGRVTT